MKGMIFAAGLGTRLRPLTDSMPKALIPVGGRPLLDRLIDKFVAAGITDITVNIHHHAEQVEHYLATHRREGVTIRLSDEREALLETGGALKHAMPLLTGDEAVLVHNVDILSNADLKALYNNKVTADADALLLVSERHTTRYLLFDETMRLVGWTNEQTGEVRSPYKDLRPGDCRKYAFSGIQVLSPRVFPRMTDYPDRFSIIDFYLKECDRIPIYGKPDDNLRLLDIGKPDALARADDFLKMLRDER